MILVEVNGVMLSVIIPVFNTEKYLKACLDSIVHQTYDNFEIIIINDGSTDSSLSIIEKYAQKYEKVYYFSQINQGQGAARNLGIEKSNGKYIYFMDSDDILELNAFQELIKTLEGQNLEAVMFDGSSFWNPDDDVNTEFANSYIRRESYGKFEYGEDLLFKMKNNNEFTVSPCLYIFKKEILSRSGLKFVEGIIHEDQIFTTELYLKTHECLHVNKIYFNRRIREGSTMTGNQIERAFLGNYAVLNHFNLLLKEYEFKDSRYQHTLRKTCSYLFRLLTSLYYENELDSVSNQFEMMNSDARSLKYYNFKGFICRVSYNFYKKIYNVKNKNGIGV